MNVNSAILACDSLNGTYFDRLPAGAMFRVARGFGGEYHLQLAYYHVGADGSRTFDSYDLPSAMIARRNPGEPLLWAEAAIADAKLRTSGRSNG